MSKRNGILPAITILEENSQNEKHKGDATRPLISAPTKIILPPFNQKLQNICCHICRSSPKKHEIFSLRLESSLLSNSKTSQEKQGLR